MYPSSSRASLDTTQNHGLNKENVSCVLSSFDFTAIDDLDPSLSKFILPWI